jgi:hypothetical protein
MPPAPPFRSFADGGADLTGTDLGALPDVIQWKEDRSCGPSPARRRHGCSRERREHRGDVGEEGADLAEETAQTGPKDIRPNGYGKGDEHDQQCVFGRCGAPFVVVKMFDQAAHL